MRKAVMITVLVLAVCAVLSVAIGQGSSPQILVTWTRPTTGSPAVKFDLEISTNGGNWTTIATPSDTFAYVSVPEGSNVFRVRAANIFNEWGEYSETSDPVIYHGPPGICGRPSVTIP